MHTHPDREQRDLRLPDHRHEDTRSSAVVRVLGAVAGAVGVTIVAAIYLVGAPIVALVTGTGQILMEIRDNALRPRLFVGARHGMPFLDPAPPAPPAEPDTTET